MFALTVLLLVPRFRGICSRSLTVHIVQTVSHFAIVSSTLRTQSIVLRNNSWLSFLRCLWRVCYRVRQWFSSCCGLHLGCSAFLECLLELHSRFYQEWIACPASYESTLFGFHRRHLRHHLQSRVDLLGETLLVGTHDVEVCTDVLGLQFDRFILTQNAQEVGFCVQFSLSSHLEE